MEQEKLTREIIVGEAITLLNEEGLEGVSLRKLAERVGVKAPSLYWHFKDKSALMSAVMERIFGECLDSVPDHTDWQQWMRAFGKALWRTQGMVRDFGRLITTTDMDIDQLQRTTRRIRKRLQSVDLPESDAMEMQSTIQALITGWSGFARAPYSRALAKTLDFDKLAMRSLDALIEGKASELALRSARRKRKS
ncbi:MAG: TetR family transcriptional regulator [Proteobacteria bacterium]|jgi:TetR/AcrR family tetracycline transcriptional repressor|nr:TetR family transcriptional regulator [Pseudomonadota bacterium]